ncbi:MAG: molybdopterin molybdotransferase MoeA [Calditrichia bacterium]
MLTIEQALQQIQDALPKPLLEERDIANCSGYLLAEDIVAVEPAPLFTNSAMDGYATKWEDVKDATPETPITLHIAGESQAGIPMNEVLTSGYAARISTGARLMPGADTVIPIEVIHETETTINVLKVNKPHQHIRNEGEEFTAGEKLLLAGCVLGPPQLAILASQGITKVSTFKAPSVSVIATGTELVPFHEKPAPGQIRDSNRLMLSCAVTDSGGTIGLSSHVSDNYSDTVKSIEDAASNAGIILFSGGVSVGPHDLVKDAAAECGFNEIFWRVRQKPGKPLFFAQRGDTLLFGLPGNPVSSYMSYMVYVHPVIRYLCGHPFKQDGFIGCLAEDIHNTMDRAHLMRVAIQHVDNALPEISPLARQGSHMISSISGASGFIRVNAGEMLKAGTEVRVIPLSKSGRE